MPLLILVATLHALLTQVDSLAAEHRFAEAEQLARQAVAQYPASRDAHLALGRALLWQGRYAEARRELAPIVAHNPGDGDARLALAQAEYWSGDYRRALRDFRGVAQREEARRAISEIESAARSGYVVRGGALSDDQPYRANSAGMSLFAFSDPLTRWQLDLADARRRAFAGLRATTPDARASVSATFVPVTVTASIARQRFGDDTTRTLPAIGASWRGFAVNLAREALLRSAASLRTHPTADVVSARWSRGDRIAVHAETLRYFDRNRGTTFDAYAVKPFGAFALGASAAYRDTRESRFVNGIYDPYYTPKQQREVRAVASWSRRGFGVHLDGGIAHDAVAGAFHPWRASAGFTRGPFSLSAERNSTAFYTSNEIVASVAGRF